MDGKDARKQHYDSKLAKELRYIFRCPYCLIGTPRACGPNRKYWRGFMRGRSFSMWSSFISRPDEAPCIDRPDYWEKVRSLWRDRDVVLVRGGGSLTKAHIKEARVVREIPCREHDAWWDVDGIESEIGVAGIVLLCLGATATVLADRLARKGIWAVDLGSVGRFLGNIRE